MNKIILIGRLTRDPQCRYLDISNSLMTTFTLAVNRRFVKEEAEQKADFINCIAWSNTAEFINKYFKKGQQIGLVGRLQSRSWEDETGGKHYSTDVITEEVYFADSKKEDNSIAKEEIIEAEDLPF
jgi:single stranded DNA-binding protein (ssb)